MPQKLKPIDIFVDMLDSGILFTTIYGLVVGVLLGVLFGSSNGGIFATIVGGFIGGFIGVFISGFIGWAAEEAKWKKKAVDMVGEYVRWLREKMGMRPVP